jgi:hypothetical protein
MLMVLLLQPVQKGELVAIQTPGVNHQRAAVAAVDGTIAKGKYGRFKRQRRSAGLAIGKTGPETEKRTKF